MPDESQRFEDYPIRSKREIIPGTAVGKGLLIIMAVLAIPAHIAVYYSAEDLLRQRVSRPNVRVVSEKAREAVATMASAIRLDAALGVIASVILLALAFAMDTYPLPALLSGTFISLSRFASFILMSSSVPYRWPLLLASAAFVLALSACVVRAVFASNMETTEDANTSTLRIPGRGHFALQVAYVLVIATPVTTLLVITSSGPGPREPLHFLVISAINSAILSVIVLCTMMSIRLPKLPRSTQGSSKAWTVAPLVVVSLAIVALSYQYCLSMLLPDRANHDAMREHAHLLLGWIVVGCAVPAVLEEWLFRRLAIAAFSSLMSVPAAIIVSSAMFASAHVLAPLNSPIFFLLGLVLGWSHVRTGRLVLPILLHFCFNVALLAISIS